MAKKMLIDATHAEETRVVVVDGNKVEEFDFESENKRQLAGNIYLAKVTRVEPSLQAAFVDYGGNRHGFLAFSEIHPDYYQIPVADREALMAEERAYAKAQQEEDENPQPRKRRSRSRSRSRSRATDVASKDAVATEEVATPVETETSAIGGMDVMDVSDADATTSTLVDDAPVVTDATVDAAPTAPDATDTPVAEDAPLVGTDVTPTEAEAEATDTAEAAPAEAPVAEATVSEDAVVTEAAPAAEETQEDTAKETPSDDEGNDEDGDDDDAPLEATEKDENIESVADDDVTEEIRRPRKPRAKRYKIQEVIKVRQILLVQVVKEERGNKGAALTTYLSLAGRYCVLMPNTARGGGISRKITNAADRKKLKQIATEIDVPEGAGLIVRTAGAARTKAEIKRDYEYLQRMWEQIRELTLKSVAPAQIYEEGDLIKRSIRDLYNSDIDEVHVEGENGYRTAKDFMKMIMPSHAKNVKRYREQMPLFARFQVESYLSGMLNPTVQLKSGGYIVIDVTEALVAVDVNSGRATKEGSIEDTAVKTNLEAAEEVARQVRLRDLAGLIVIDFIDMEDRRNNNAVEKRMKDKLKTDRARIQVGRISGFGLMEMSRQRLRPGIIEATTQPCAHCHGTGLIRSDENLALSILRQIEEEGVRGRTREVLLKAPLSIVNYLINNKREHIATIEARYRLSVRIECDMHMVVPDFSIEKFKTATRKVNVVASSVVSGDVSMMDDIDEAMEVEEETAAETVSEEAPTETVDGEEQPKKRRRRRRRRRGGRNRNVDADGNEIPSEEGASDDTPETAETEDAAPVEAEAPSTDAEAPAEATTEEAPAKPKRKRAPRKTAAQKAAEAEAAAAETSSEAPAEAKDDAAAAEDEAPAKPKRKRAPRKTAAQKAAEAEAAGEDAPAEKPKRKRATKKKVDAVAAPEAVEAVAEMPATETVADAPVAQDVAVETVAEAAPVETIAEPIVAEAPVETVAEVSVEPIAEPVVSAPVVTEEAPKVDAPAKPKRKGWWSLK